MPLPVDDTLTPRNSAPFEVVRGIIGHRNVPFADLGGLPSDLAPGAVVSVPEDDYNLWVWTGVNWHQVTPTPPPTPTLATVYGAGGNTILLNAADGPIHINDDAVSIGSPLFAVSGFLGFDFQNYFFVSPTGGAAGDPGGFSPATGRLTWTTSAATLFAPNGTSTFGIDNTGAFVSADVRPTTNNARDVGTNAARFRTGRFDTSLLTPALDRRDAGNLLLGTGTATGGMIGKFASGTGSFQWTSLYASLLSPDISRYVQALDTHVQIASGAVGVNFFADNVTPTSDNVLDLGTTSARYKTLHLGPGSLVVHNDATDTVKVALDISGGSARLVGTGLPLYVQAPATHGVESVGALSVGATAVTTKRFQPNEAEAPPYEEIFSQFDNPSGTRKNQVRSEGFNVNQAIATEAQFQITLEALYDAGLGPVSEWYIATNKRNGGAALRPFTFDLDHVTGVVAMVMRPNTLQIQKASNNATLWSMNTAEGMWQSGDLGDFPGLSVSNNENIPLARHNGVDTIACFNYSDTGFETRISQDNVPTRMQSRTTIIGRANFDGSTNDLSARLDFMRGQSAAVSDANKARIRYNGTDKTVEASTDAGAYRAFGGAWTKLATYTTVGRPSAVTAGAGAMIYDTDLSLPIFSDGTDWLDAAGNVV